MCMRNENGAFKNTNEDRPFLKPQKPLLSGWVGLLRYLRRNLLRNLLRNLRRNLLRNLRRNLR